MTRERAAELLPVIQAFVNGEVVEKRYNDGGGAWVSCACPEWCDNRTYRIKPKPLEVWTNLYRNSDGNLYSQYNYLTKEGALECGVGSHYVRTIRMREVVE